MSGEVFSPSPEEFENENEKADIANSMNVPKLNCAI